MLAMNTPLVKGNKIILTHQFPNFCGSSLITMGDMHIPSPLDGLELVFPAK
jgi:hypothetical protein